MLLGLGYHVIFFDIYLIMIIHVRTWRISSRIWLIIMFLLPSTLYSCLFLLFLGFYPSFATKECLITRVSWGLSSFSNSNWDWLILGSFSNILRNILKWLPNFCVNRFKFLASCHPILAQAMSVWLFSIAGFWSYFSGSHAKGILKSGSEISGGMLCLSKNSTTTLRTYDSLDVRKIKSLLPFCFEF